PTNVPNWTLYPTKPPNVKLDRVPENPKGVSRQAGRASASPATGHSTAPGSTKFIGIVLAPPKAPYCGPFQLGGGFGCVRVATRRTGAVTCASAGSAKPMNVSSAMLLRSIHLIFAPRVYDDASPGATLSRSPNASQGCTYVSHRRFSENVAKLSQRVLVILPSSSNSTRRIVLTT